MADGWGEPLFFAACLLVSFAQLASAAPSLPAQPKADAKKEVQLDWATASSDFGWRLYDQGRSAEALPYIARALAVEERVLGKDHIDLAATLNRLMLVQRETGRLREAEKNGRRSLALREKQYGPEHQAVGSSINNLGIVLRDLGRLEEARALYRRAQAIHEKVLGPDAPEAGIAISNQAGIALRQKKMAEAEALYRRAIVILDRAPAGFAADLGTVLFNMGNLYREEGRSADAEPYFRRSLEVREKVLTPSHPDISLTVGSLGVALNNLGRYADGLPLLQRAIALREKTLGPRDPAVAEVLVYAGKALVALNRNEEAEAALRRAIAIWDAQPTGQTGLGVDAIEALASLYEDLEDYVRAEPEAERALALRTKLAGPTHKSVGSAMNNLALVQWRRGKATEAEANFLESLRIAKAAGDESGAATTNYNLGVFYRAHRRQLEALPFAELGLQEREKVRGPWHPQTGEAAHSLALVHRDLGRCDLAAPLLYRALDIVRDARPVDEKRANRIIEDIKGLGRACGTDAA